MSAAALVQAMGVELAWGFELWHVMAATQAGVRRLPAMDTEYSWKVWRRQLDNWGRGVAMRGRRPSKGWAMSLHTPPSCTARDLSQTCYCSCSSYTSSYSPIAMNR